VAVTLKASASYLVGADIVSADAWLEGPSDADPSKQAVKPQLAKAGTVDLLNFAGRVIASATFDYRHGNYAAGDGAFHVAFLHPAEVRNLKVRFTIETFQDGTYQAEVPVSEEQFDLPLAEQPGTR